MPIGYLLSVATGLVLGVVMLRHRKSGKVILKLKMVE